LDVLLHRIRRQSEDMWFDKYTLWPAGSA